MLLLANIWIKVSYASYIIGQDAYPENIFIGCPKNEYVLPFFFNEDNFFMHKYYDDDDCKLLDFSNA